MNFRVGGQLFPLGYKSTPANAHLVTWTEVANGYQILTTVMVFAWQNHEDEGDFSSANCSRKWSTTQGCMWPLKKQWPVQYWTYGHLRYFWNFAVLMSKLCKSRKSCRISVSHSLSVYLHHVIGQSTYQAPTKVPPVRNKGWIAGLIKGNQWLIKLFIKAVFVGEGTSGRGWLTSHDISALCIKRPVQSFYTPDTNQEFPKIGYCNICRCESLNTKGCFSDKKIWVFRGDILVGGFNPFQRDS